MSASRLLTSARRTARRYEAELRASQSFLASEVGRGGWLNLGQFRWRNVTPGRAARATFGVLTPLIIGFATHHVEYGTFAALGAVPAGMVSFQGVTRTRVLLVSLAVAGMAISTFIGGAAAFGVPWALVPVIMLWCYVAGVCAALGPTAIVVTTQWPVAVLIASAVPLSPADAALRALLVLAGGLWQGALVVSSWALSLGSAERTAMAGSYATLSSYAADLAAGGVEPPMADTLPGTKALRDPNPLMRSVAQQFLVDLMEESERIRTTLAVVRGMGPAPLGAGRAVLAASAGVLGEIAEALRARPSHREEHLVSARARISPDSTADGHPWSWADESLRGQLRSAVRIAQRLNDAQPGLSRRAATRPTTRLPVRDLLLTLRANVSISSEAGRHALRLAIVAGVAEVIAQSAALPHGYWITLTVLIVLRPDYGSTLYRGLQRAAGTVVGAGLGVATVLLGHFGTWALLTALRRVAARRVRGADRELSVLRDLSYRLRGGAAGAAGAASRPDRGRPADRDRGRRGPGPAGLHPVADLGALLGQREVRPADPDRVPVRRACCCTPGRTRAATRPARRWPASSPPAGPGSTRTPRPTG